MEIKIEQQQDFLEVLGAIDGQINSIELTKKNLDKEIDKLNLDKEAALVNCQHIDEDGNLAIAGGVLYTWCQFCGVLLSDDEIENIEKEIEKLNK